MGGGRHTGVADDDMVAAATGVVSGAAVERWPPWPEWLATG